MADFQSTAFGRNTAARLEERRLAASEELIALEIDNGHAAAVIADLEGAVATNPWRERMWELLMLALNATGRQADALRAFARYRDRLADDTGLEPGAGIRRLEEQILLEDPSLPRADSPEPRTAQAPAASLPEPPTPLIGRQTEIGLVVDQLERQRLVTISGIGGIGKSRVLLAAGRRLEESGTAPVWYVDLAESTDDLALSTIAETLGARALPGVSTSKALANHLEGRVGSLLLDNVIEAVDTVADLVSSLLAANPWIRVLVTSRRPLGVEGEAIVAVGPLELAVAAADTTAMPATPATDLLVDRIAAVDADFALTTETAGPVVRIARRVSGIPAAIEMAAARCRGAWCRDRRWRRCPRGPWHRSAGRTRDCL